MSVKIKELVLTSKNLTFLTNVHNCVDMLPTPVGAKAVFKVESYFDLSQFAGSRHHYLRKLLKKSKQAYLSSEIRYELEDLEEGKGNVSIEVPNVWLLKANKKLTRFFSNPDKTPSIKAVGYKLIAIRSSHERRYS